MSKLVDIIKRIVKQEIKAQNNEIHVPCIIENVSDDYLRADVSLLADPDVIIPNRLNKSGEKLTEGQQAWLYYTTLPSSGYIGRTEGEADPMGGGGSGTTVENAAVLIPTNFHDYVINEQLIVDIQPPNMVYYGNMPAFAIIQGHYCVMANVQSTSGRWTGYTQDLFDAIIANKDKFGVQYGTETSGGWLDKVGSNNYPNYYVYVKTDLNRVTTNASGYQARINFAKYYATNNPPQPSGANWWEATITHSSSFTPYQATDINLLAPDSNYFTRPLHSYFVVPVITSYTQDNLTKDPFGEVDIDGWLIFATDDGINYGAYMHRTASSQYLRGSVPLTSDAEKAFILGISQRTEPTPSNGGA